jgi:NAD(P)-dependent dehydrogenase (short-subunit alcohol dehydrogenase family)
MATLLRGTALITGAGSGIGQYAAFAFAKHGIKKLAITDIKEENLQETVDALKKQAPDVEVEPICMDCAKEADVERMIDQVVKRFGRLDIAVNNAGIGGPVIGSAETELNGWQRVIDINLTGVWLCQRAELRQMLKQEYDSLTPYRRCANTFAVS